jgi:hypothetical protein
MRALVSVDENLVHADAREMFLTVRNNSLLLRTFEAGLEAPAITDTSWKELKLIDEAIQVGYITRRGMPDSLSKKPMIEKAGIILAILPME